MIAVGSDHGGFELKATVKKYLGTRNLEIFDCGTDNGDSVDYPDFGERVARAVSCGKAEKGILICGTGIGMSIVANKFPRVRAALVNDSFSAQMAKEHNNANILVLGGRVVSPELACQLVGIWLDSVFEGTRHQRRLDKITRIEDEVRKAQR